MSEVRNPWRWRPLTGIPPDAHEWLAPEHEALAAEWVGLKDRLAKDARAAAFVGDRLVRRRREFAVETGAIERLYHLRRGVTQHLVAEGLHTAVAAHTVEGVRTETLRGLLADQEAALEKVYRDTAADADVSPSMLKRIPRHRTPSRAAWTIRHPTVPGPSARRITNRRSGSLERLPQAASNALASS